MEALPENTVINKGLTGCGATTLAIQQERDTIIAVPFIPLIVNKTEKHKDVLLGLYGEGDFRPEIANYLADHDRIKIMATYDAIPKLCSALRYFGYDPYKRIHLVIDE